MEFCFQDLFSWCRLVWTLKLKLIPKRFSRILESLEKFEKVGCSGLRVRPSGWALGFATSGERAPWDPWRARLFCDWPSFHINLHLILILLCFHKLGVYCTFCCHLAAERLESDYPLYILVFWLLALQCQIYFIIAQLIAPGTLNPLRQSLLGFIGFCFRLILFDFQTFWHAQALIHKLTARQRLCDLWFLCEGTLCWCELSLSRLSMGLIGCSCVSEISWSFSWI